MPVSIASAALSDADAQATALLFRALGDPTRVRIVNVLASSGEPVCVCEVQPLLGLSQGTVSYHLKQLVEAGVIERENRGTYSYFGLVPGALEAIREVFSVPARVAVAADPDATAAACC